MQKNMDVLMMSPLFAGIDSGDMDAMLACLGAKDRAFSKGEVILREGTPAEMIGVVLSGAVQVIREDYFGNRSMMAKLGPSELFAEAFALAGVDLMPVTVMAAEDCALSALVCQLPPFKTTAREVEVKSGRAALMRAIMESSEETASELAGGLRITTDAGTVTVVPAAEKNAVRITGESESEELADKLCAKYERLALELDGR